MAVCAVVTEVMVAVNTVLLDPAGTVSEAGIVTALLLLARFTTAPPVAAAAFNVAVQLSVPAPVIAPLLQLSELSTGAPVPLRLMIEDGEDDELLVRVTCPVKEPAVVGLNCTVKAAVCPGFSVIGNVAPEIVKPAPVKAAEFMVTDALPVEDKVSVCVADELIATLPKAILAELMVSVGTEAFN